MGWYSRTVPGENSLYRRYPKVDLHRHLEGSVRVQTLLEIAAQYRIPLPQPDLHTLVQIQPGDTFNSATFLSKFQTLRQFYRSPEVIQRVTREAIEDAAQDGVVYLEMRFTPVALGRLQGFSAAQVMDWVTGSAREASEACGITVRLIASINRHEPVEIAEEIEHLAAKRLDRGIVGLDLAGDEARFPALPFVGVFRKAQKDGLRVTIHAGEWGGASNIRDAIEIFGAERIGHGVRVLEDPQVVRLAVERGITLDVCITSNTQSGVVPTLAAHPLQQLINAGLKVTLNSDDPSISGITLSDEYRLAQEILGINSAVLADCILNGARAAFLPQAERNALFERLAAALPIAAS